MAETSINLKENVVGALCYVLGWITGIVFLIVEKKNRFVRFHAMQSLVTFLSLSVIRWIFRWIPFVGRGISVLIWILSLILWLVLMIKAYQGEMYKLPIIGDFAEGLLKNRDAKD
ncbi:hypothetical protein DRJ00_04610 [Candidatus Aerophobetes bacterium]|uniref:DUF4870 domain-containing protein n=1 Tax=Aerophobetes bacterium TaxID=2030807 RepID=A0A497E3U0_UNCAE|nr:MAG: hypothetical protein DRJ00_04610 [Candidatus Aerophobetes bacterium]